MTVLGDAMRLSFALLGERGSPSDPAERFLATARAFSSLRAVTKNIADQRLDERRKRLRLQRRIDVLTAAADDHHMVRLCQGCTGPPDGEFHPECPIHGEKV